MIREGSGTSPPTPVLVSLTDHDLRGCVREAQERARRRGYDRGDVWARGLLSPTVIPNIGVLSAAEHPIYIGCLGEYALEVYLRRRGLEATRNWSSTEPDNGCDVLIEKCLTCQVKTRTKWRDVTFVRCSERRCSEVLVSAESGHRHVSLLGWTRRDPGSFPVVRAAAGHDNHEIPNAALEPMSRLVEWAKVRRCLC